MTVAPRARLIRVAEGRAGPECLIVPGAGAGFVPYLRLAASLQESLGAGVAFIRTAGLVPGEVPERSIGEMADSVLASLLASSAMPGLILGWSLGGLVAWELCVRLADRGHLPDLVIVDSYPLPQAPEPAEAEQVRQAVLAELGPNASREAIDALLGTFEAQLAALADYEARRGYPGRVLSLVCAPHERAGSAVALARWQELAPHLDTAPLDATHHEIFDPGHLPSLTRAVGTFLGRARKGRIA